MEQSWLKQLFCKHKVITWIRNIHGDEINHCGSRSLFRCFACGKYIWSDELITFDNTRANFTFTFNNHLKIKGEIMAFTLPDDGATTGKLNFVDKKGFAAGFQKGSIKFTSSDEKVLTLVQDPNDEESVTAIAGAPGVAGIHIDANDVDGNPIKMNDIAVEVIPGDAVNAGIAFGPVFKQAAAESAKADEGSTATTSGTDGAPQ